MKRLRVPMKGLIAGAVLAGVFSLAGPPPASAQEATTAPTTSTSEATAAPTVRRRPRTTASPAMIEEAIERSKARTQRWLSEGVPEQFGSEGSRYTTSSGVLTAQ